MSVSGGTTDKLPSSTDDDILGDLLALNACSAAEWANVGGLRDTVLYWLLIWVGLISLLRHSLHLMIFVPLRPCFYRLTAPFGLSAWLLESHFEI